MKKFIMAAMALLIATGVFSANKFAKDAKKQAKQMTKQGWIVSPGALPLERQLEEAYEMRAQRDENGDRKYVWGEGQSVAENYDAAKISAINIAITNLAQQIQTNVTALIDNTVGNKQLTAEEAKTITESVMASKSLIAQNIKRTITVVECYQILKNKNRLVQVQIAYSWEKAQEVASQAIVEDLEKKGSDLHKKLEKLLENNK